MNNLNSILIEGNMVRDPIARTTPKGSQVCSFSIASNRYYTIDGKMEHEVSFFDVESWGKLAELVQSEGQKGRAVRVVGRLKQDRWTGTDQKPRSKVSIVAEHIEFRPQPEQGSSAVEMHAAAGAPETALAEAALAEPALTAF
jgi:single-strand DNA-binding protein